MDPVTLRRIDFMLLHLLDMSNYVMRRVVSLECQPLVCRPVLLYDFFNEELKHCICFVC